jgi:hypothetical protein
MYVRMGAWLNGWIYLYMYVSNVIRWGLYKTLFYSTPLQFCFCCNVCFLSCKFSCSSSVMYNQIPHHMTRNLDNITPQWGHIISEFNQRSFENYRCLLSILNECLLLQLILIYTEYLFLLWCNSQ